MVLTPSERQAAHRKRRNSAGQRQIAIYLPTKILAGIDKAARREGHSRSEEIERRLSASAGPPAKAYKPSPKQAAALKQACEAVADLVKSTRWRRGKRTPVRITGTISWKSVAAIARSLQDALPVWKEFDPVLDQLSRLSRPPRPQSPRSPAKSRKVR